MWGRFNNHARGAPQVLSAHPAIDAIDSGDLPTLNGILDREPVLIAYRWRQGTWYEEGYFAGAALLHHVAGNPIRCPLPPNIIEVAKCLLSRGADPNALTDAGQSTIHLLLTSKQASEAEVSLALIDLLSAAGAKDNLHEPNLLDFPLLNDAPWTAEELIRRGINMGLRHAAALGRLADMGRALTRDTWRVTLEEALVFACIRGQEEAARLLVVQGVKGDTLTPVGGQTPRSALHEAANRGYLRIVKLLLENGANPNVKEPRWNGTPAGWAEHGGHREIAELLRQRAGD